MLLSRTPCEPPVSLYLLSYYSKIAWTPPYPIPTRSYLLIKVDGETCGKLQMTAVACNSIYFTLSSLYNLTRIEASRPKEFLALVMGVHTPLSPLVTGKPNIPWLGLSPPHYPDHPPIPLVFSSFPRADSDPEVGFNTSLVISYFSLNHEVSTLQAKLSLSLSWVRSHPGNKNVV